MINRKHKKIIHIALPNFVGSDQLFLDGINLDNQLNHGFQQAKWGRYHLGEAMLFNLLTADKEVNPPYAAISAIGSELEVGHNGWLRADPIELWVDAGNICLIGRDHLMLEEQESLQLLQTLNSLLVEDDIQILAGTPNEWYINLPLPEQIKTYPLYEVIARDIRQFLPAGDNHKHWHQLITELQMLLFNHIVNLNRQQMKRPIINSVWFWGEGQQVTRYLLRNYTLIISDHSLVKGMHTLSEQKMPLIATNEQSLNSSNFEEPGEYLITINHYQQGLAPITTLIIDLLEKVQARSLHQLIIYLGSGSMLTWHAPRFSLPRFVRGWRK